MKKFLFSIFGIRKIFYIPILIALAFGYISVLISPNVEVKYVYKVLPAFVVYTDNMNEGMGGKAVAMVVFIDNQYIENNVILTHELKHVEQGYRTLFTQNLLIPYSDTLLVKIECEAYATEVESLQDIEWLAKFLKEEYETSLSERRIKGYLVYYWQMQKR